nr:BTB/POZ and MATH domain-containing protein 2-like [Aegilops tauschii subsp. strangulata]
MEIVVCIDNIWKTERVLGSWFVDGMYGFLLQRLCHVRVPDLEYDGVSGVLPQSDSFNESTFEATTTTVQHVLRIKGYPALSEIYPNGKGFRSDSFPVGGTSWHIDFFPNGDSPETAGFVSVFAVLDRTATEVSTMAKVGFDLLDQATGEPAPRYARAGNIHDFTQLGEYWGFGDFIKREELDKDKDLLKDGTALSVRCNVMVLDFLAAPAMPPPPDWPLHMRDLLHSGQGADVRFLVGEETFAAHRCLLAARSAVFKAELYGPMMEGATHNIRIDGMRAQVFNNLLHFAYTDSLPQSDQDDDVVVAMAQHLMEAADRYAMERLKLLCEDVLRRKISVATAATTLALAEQHGCHRLKEACFELILKSPTTLDQAMTPDDLDHLSKTCPSLLNELTSKHAAIYSNLNNEKAEKSLPSSNRKRGRAPTPSLGAATVRHTRRRPAPTPSANQLPARRLLG